MYRRRSPAASAERHWPRPAPRPRRHQEIVIRGGQAADARACAALDASYTTTHVWQLDARQDGEELRVSFRLVRLPRELALTAPHRPPAARAGGRRDALWLVAEEIVVDEDGRPGSSAALRDESGRPGPVRPGQAGTIAGYVAAAVPAQDENAYLQTLVVDRTFRRRGIAANLLAHAQRWAASQGATHLIADVPARNYPALQLLHRVGFTFCGYNDRCYSGQEVALFLATRLR